MVKLGDDEYVPPTKPEPLVRRDARLVRLIDQFEAKARTSFPQFGDMSEVLAEWRNGYPASADPARDGGGGQSRTEAAAAARDLAADETRELCRDLEKIIARLDHWARRHDFWTQASTARPDPGSGEPGCESCRRVKVWSPLMLDDRGHYRGPTDVGGRMTEAKRLCWPCYRRVIAVTTADNPQTLGDLIPRDDLTQYHQRGRWPAVRVS